MKGRGLKHWLQIFLSYVSQYKTIDLKCTHAHRECSLLKNAKEWVLNFIMCPT